MKNYDLTLKDILNGLEKAFVKAFLHFEIKNAKALNVEFQKIEEKIADYVCEIEDLNNQKSILHIEFQTNNHSLMHIRMARYLIELYHKYNLPIIQVVLYMGSEKLNMKSEISFEILDTKIEYKYKIIDIKNINCREFLNSNESDLVILAILCDLNEQDKSKVIREILQKIDKINYNDEIKKKDYFLKLTILSRLRKLEDTLRKEKKMLEAIKLQDIPVYQWGIEEGIEKGREEGRQEGEKVGIEKEKIHIAINMLKAGINMKDIATFTELSIEEIQKLKEKKENQENQ